MAKRGFERWPIGRSLLAAVCVLECGCWFHEDLAVSRRPGAPRPRLVAVARFRPMVYGADESQSRPGLADAVTIGCENGLDVVRVDMVAPIRVAAAMADAHVAFPDQTNAVDMARRVQADAVIVGSVNFFKFSTDVDVRLVRAKTGRSTRRPTWRGTRTWTSSVETPVALSSRPTAPMPDSATRADRRSRLGTHSMARRSGPKKQVRRPGEEVTLRHHAERRHDPPLP